MWVEMPEISSSLENGIDRVDSLFNEDSKTMNYLCPNFGGRTTGNFREMNKNRDICCYASKGVVNLERKY